MQKNTKRIVDFILSLGGIIVLLPFFFIIGTLIIMESRGGVFFKQLRVGQYGKDFVLYKFRTMKPHSEKLGQLTIGTTDNRITRMGKILRRFKLDELPQLLNVVRGDMSLVGPRPEVRKYTNMYSEAQLEVLNVKPGITDYASIKYFNENELLGKSQNPEETYIKDIMPEKLNINLEYARRHDLARDFAILWITLLRILHLKR
jgi:lipopolysaccharide/colanic/teichoic acid biosynthesis glycosyltransferase